MNSRRRLRIGFDGHGFTSPAAGIRRYAGELVRALVGLDEVDILTLGGDPALTPPGTEYVAGAAHPPSNAGWSLVGLPRTAARARVDLVHAPAYTAPFWCRVPVVLTIHDVSYAIHPEWYPYRRDWLRRAFYRRSATSAARVLTVSAFSASEITAAYGIPPERIAVAPLGVDHHTFMAADADMPLDLPAAISQPYLLHVGDVHERRNLPMVVDALLEARRHFGGAGALSLVVAGVDRGITAGLCEMAAEEGSVDAVVALGHVGDARIHALYRGALALVYPSFYEGFGLPLVEAMATGLPIIASHAASIPEVLGGAGLLLDPNDRAAWRDAIIRVVNDEALRADLRARGLARAATFTWQRTARLTLDAYREAVRAA